MMFKKHYWLGLGLLKRTIVPTAVQDSSHGWAKHDLQWKESRDLCVTCIMVVMEWPCLLYSRLCPAQALALRQSPPTLSVLCCSCSCWSSSVIFPTTSWSCNSSSTFCLPISASNGPSTVFHMGNGIMLHGWIHHGLRHVLTGLLENRRDQYHLLLL